MADYLKIPEVAQLLGLSEKTVRRRVKGGEIPSVFVGGVYRISRAGLEDYLETARVRPGKKADAPQRSGQPRGYRIEVKPGDPTFGVSREDLAPYGIGVTDAELNALNVYLEGLVKDPDDVALIVSWGPDKVDHERISRLGQFVLARHLLPGKAHEAVTEGIREWLLSRAS